MNQTLLKRTLSSIRAYACATLLSGLCLASAHAQTSNAALQFDGVDDYVSLGTTKFNNLKSVTFAAWIYRTGNNASGFDVIVAKENIVSFAINNSNDLLRLNFGNGTTWGTSVESNTTIPMNTWTHVAGTRDINTGIVTLYINGVEVGSGSNTGFGANTNDAAIGHKPGAPFVDAAFEGIVDEFRIWGKSLCASEVNAYSNGMISTTLSQLWASLSFESGIPNDDNSALSTVSDFTGNYPGTLNNFDLIGTTSNFVPGNTGISGNCTAYALTTPTITTGGGTSICSGSSLALSTTAVASQYYWSNGQTGAVCNATTSGAYTVTTYDYDGCNAISSSVSLTTSPSYSITAATYTAGAVSFCRGLSQMISVRVNYSPVGSKSFQLQLSTDSNFSTINYSTSATLTGGVGTLSFAGTAVRLWAAGKYFVRVTSTCITNGSMLLGPIQVWAPITVQAMSNSPVCSGDPLTMNATDGANTYAWIGPNGFSASVKSATLNSALVLPGIYTVTATNGCGVYIGTTNVVINSLPDLAVNTTNASCPGASNGSVLLSSTDGNTPLTYSINNESNGQSLFNNLSAGDYAISLVNSKGCKSEQAIHIADEDQTPPTALAKDITVVLDANGNAQLDASAIDNGSFDVCGIQAMTVEPSNFGLAQVGTNLVTLSVTDNSGNTTQTTSIVTVKDMTAPEVMAHPSLDLVLSNEGSATIDPSQFIIYASDASGIASSGLSVNSFNCSSVGDNTIVLSVTDNNGNTTIQPVVVHIIDNTAPVVSVNNITAYIDASGTVTVSPEDINNGSTDACGIQSTGLSQTAFSCANLGANTVVFTVTDVNGNSTSTDVNITIADNMAPVIRLKSAYNLVLDANGAGAITTELLDSATSDNCSGAMTFSASKTNFTASDLGTNTVVFTAVDAAGNSAISEINVVVIDAEKPVVTVPGNQTRILSKTCFYLTTGTEFDPTMITDNNTPVDANTVGVTVVYTLSGATTATTGVNSLQGVYFAQGSTLVNWTVTDGSGNTGTGNYTVTVLDQTAPIVTTQNLSLTLPASGTISITANDVNAGSTDNCSIQSISVNPTTFNNTNIGANTVTLTVVDAAGNTTSATATVTIAPTPSTFTNPTIYINSSNKVQWVNIPGVSNGTSGVIGSGTTFNGNQITLTSTGGSISSSTTTGLGVTGAGTSATTCGGTSYMNETINKSQTVKVTLNNTAVGITGLVFRSTYAAKVMVNGRRNGQTVITFSKYMTANDYDTFDFTTACALRGICTVDEIEFKMSDRTSGCVRRWNQYDDNENNDYEDGTNLSANCGFTINNMMIAVKAKDDCNVGSIAFKLSDGVFASKVVALSDNLSTGISNVHSLATNSDGIFTTGSPVSNNAAKRIVVGYNWLGMASAWEITSQCKLRTIRQGLLSNSEALPVGNVLNLLVYEYKITSVSTTGQFIYGTRKNRSTGVIADIRWRVNEYFQRVWVSDPQVIVYSKNGESELFSDDDITVIDEAQNELGDLNVSIYPNPSNDVFNFKLESGSLEPFNVEVYDMMGRLIQSNENLNAGNEAAIGRNLNAGVYLVKVTQGTQVRFAKVTRLN